MPADFPFDVVAFDLDGTLADTAPDLTAALNHALGVLGRPPVPADDVRHMVGHGARALLQKGLAATGVMTEDLVERGFPIFIDYYLDHIADGSTIFPGLDEDGWLKLSRNWALFFVALAIVNEVMRATLTFETWLTTKVWGVPIVSLIFAAANIPMLLRHGLDAEAKKDVVSEAPVE